MTRARANCEGQLALVLLGALCISSCVSQSEVSGTPGNSDAARPRYSLAANFSPTGQVGQPVVGTLRLEPHSPYHVTADYPHELIVSGPEAASPRKIELERSDLDVVTRDEVVERLAIRFAAPGVHRLSAVLKFSLCTKERCEVLTGRHSWTVEVR